MLDVVRRVKCVEHRLNHKAVLHRLGVRRCDWWYDQILETRIVMLGFDMLGQRFPITGPICILSTRKERSVNNCAPAIET